MKAVIIAAGNSSRLWPETNKAPKTLLPFGEGTILSNIISSLSCAGIDEFVFVLGFKYQRIVDYLEHNKYINNNSKIVINNAYHRGNGLSVSAAEQAVEQQDFILSMSDHIVAPEAIKRVILSEKDKNLLLVDKRIDRIYDIDDATKVYCRDECIQKIGKNITSFNGIDCGIFRLNQHFFDAMKWQEKRGNESISAGVDALIEKNDMEAIFLKENERWIDIDTPEAYRHAKGMFL